MTDDGGRSHDGGLNGLIGEPWICSYNRYHRYVGCDGEVLRGEVAPMGDERDQEE
jgi:hypothetical protein